MVVPQHLTIVTIGSRDVAAQRAFFARWGWHENEGGTDDYASYDVGGLRLAVFGLGPLGEEAAPGEDGPEQGWNGVTLAINVDSARRVDEIFAAALDAGATKVADPVTRFWGGYSGYVADPDGNRWELAWAPTPDAG